MEIDGVRVADYMPKQLDKFQNLVLGSGAKVVNGHVTVFGDDNNAYDTLEDADENKFYYYGIDAKDQTVLSSVADALTEQRRIGAAARSFYQFNIDRNAAEMEAFPNDIDLYMQLSEASHRAGLAMNVFVKDGAAFDDYIEAQTKKTEGDSRYFTDNGIKVPLSGLGEKAEFLKLISSLDTVRRVQAANIEHGVNTEISEIDLNAVQTKITALCNGASVDDLNRLDKVFKAESYAAERRRAYATGGSVNEYDANGKVVNTVTVAANVKLADFWTYQATIQKQLKANLLESSGRLIDDQKSVLDSNFNLLIARRDGFADAGFADDAAKEAFRTFFDGSVKAKAVANENAFKASLSKSYSLVNSTRDQRISNLETIDTMMAFDAILDIAGAGASIVLDSTKNTAAQITAGSVKRDAAQAVLAKGHTGVDLSKYDVNNDGRLDQADYDFVKTHVLSENKDFQSLNNAVKYIDTNKDMDVSVVEIQDMFSNFNKTVNKRSNQSGYVKEADFDGSGKVDYNDFLVLMTVVARSQHLDEFAASGSKAMNMVISEMKKTQLELDKYSGIKYQHLDAMENAEKAKVYYTERDLYFRAAWSERLTEWGASVDNNATWALMLNANRFFGVDAAERTLTENQFEAFYHDASGYREAAANDYARGDSYWYNGGTKYAGSVDQDLMHAYEKYDQANFLLCGGRSANVIKLGVVYDKIIDARQEFYGHYNGLFSMDKEKEVASLKLKEYNSLYSFRSALWSTRNRDFTGALGGYFDNHVKAFEVQVAKMEKYLRDTQTNVYAEVEVSITDPKTSIVSKVKRVEIVNDNYKAMMSELDKISNAGGYVGLGLKFGAVNTALTTLDADHDGKLGISELSNAIAEMRSNGNFVITSDIDGDGNVNAEDLYHLLSAGNDFSKVRSSRDLVDSNYDGSLSITEGNDALDGLLSMLGKKSSEAVAAERYDIDGDNTVTLKDFKLLHDITGISIANTSGRVLGAKALVAGAAAETILGGMLSALGKLAADITAKPYDLDGDGVVTINDLKFIKANTDIVTTGNNGRILEAKALVAGAAAEDVLGGMLSALGKPATDSTAKAYDLDGDGVVSIKDFNFMKANTNIITTGANGRKLEAKAFVDKDANGVVSASESETVLGGLIAALGKTVADRTAAPYDLDGDGTVTIKDFKFVVENTEVATTDTSAKILKAKAFVDKDSDGTVSAAESETVLNDFISTLGKSASDSSVAAYDFDADGTISTKDFKFLKDNASINASSLSGKLLEAKYVVDVQRANQVNSSIEQTRALAELNQNLDLILSRSSRYTTAGTDDLLIEKILNPLIRAADSASVNQLLVFSQLAATAAVRPESMDEATLARSQTRIETRIRNNEQRVIKRINHKIDILQDRLTNLRERLMNTSDSIKKASLEKAIATYESRLTELEAQLAKD